MTAPLESYVARVLSVFESYPDRDAVVWGEQRVSCAAAHETVLALANAMRHRGLVRGDRVALLVSNRPEAVLLQLAVHLIGCRLVFVPPEPVIGEQVAFLRRADATAFVFHPHLARGAELAEHAVAHHVFTLGPADTGEDLLALGARMPATAPDDIAGPDDVSTVFYTGGTTGRPKMVLHRHRYYTGLTFGAARRKAECPTPQRFLIPTLVTHSSGHVASLTALLAEGTAVLMDRFDAGTVIATIQREQITSVVLHPPMLYQVLDHPELPADGFPSLIRLHYGGAPTAPARIRQAMERFGPVLRQTYGMTEVPVITLLEPADHAALAPDRLGACGKPLEGMVEVSVRDPEGAEVPAGEVGEVCVRGQLVMAEYWKDPEQTRVAMSGGWLHTGDLGRFDPDGYLYLVDRANDVIISGLTSTAHNVYSNLLEDVLARQPGVRMAAAVGLPDDVYGELVHAVCVAEPGMTVDVAELRKRVLDELGEHYVPKSIVFVDSLPWTSIGKVDKKVLRNLVAEAGAA
ncbi:MAG TPA: AMP-binding protein [Micromonosporaceae bacterium]|nr:AMP-binding protein [Micromonosporaceae bacterium]